MSEKELKSINETNEALVRFSYRVDWDQYIRIKKHVHKLKKAKNQTSDNWFEDACKEKLENDQSEIDDYDQRDRNLCFALNDDVNKAVDERVELLKRANLNFSKKKWFLEAFLDKVNREEEKTNDFKKKSYEKDLLKKLCQGFLSKLSNF